MLQAVGEWIWQEHLWLPANVSWSDLEDKEGRVYAKASQLYAALPYALCLIVLRDLFERYIATPLANIWGILDRIHPLEEENPILEKYFCNQKQIPTQDDVRSLSKKTDWPEKRVELWFKKRKDQELSNLQTKFSEASWRGVFYFFAFFGGILALYDKPWLYNLREVWAGFPKQSLLPSQYWYYLLEMGFYLSLIFSFMFDVKRKESKIQMIHHITTLILLSFSWISNYIRIGTLVMVIHDSSDTLLEGAKVLNYAAWHRTANTIYAVFTTVFVVTRLIVFPFWLIHCTWVYPLELFPPFFGYYFFNTMLLVLQLLNIYWAVRIFRMAYKLYIFGKLEGDDSDE